MKTLEQEDKDKNPNANPERKIALDHDTTEKAKAAPPVQRTFDINWNKIETVNELKLVFSCIGLTVGMEGDIVPENIKPLFHLGLITERKK